MTSSDRLPTLLDRRRLDSWKEIAAHLGRTVRTVQRWERDEGLPVHRHLHQKQATIYAYADEIDAWWTERRKAVEFAPPAAPVPEVAAAPDRSQGQGSHPPVSAVRWVRGAVVSAASVAVLLMVIAMVRGTPTPGTPGTQVASADADDLYRQGRDHWNARTPRGFDEARRAFEAALIANPRHARAHAGLADTYSLLEAFGLMTADEALPRAQAAAEKALQLDPDLGEAHASLSFVLWELHDTAGAMAQARRAIELDPAYATARHWYSLFLQQFLRREEAIAEGRKAVALDPARPILWTDLAGVLRGAGRVAEAKAVLEEARTRHPAFADIYLQLSEIARLEHRTSEAARLLRRAVALGDNRPRNLAALGCLESLDGDAAGADEALRLLNDLALGGQHVPDDAFAMLLAWTGDLDGAFARIRRGLDQRQEWVAVLFGAPACFQPVRRDPRWPDVVAELERASWLPIGSQLSRRNEKLAQR